MNLAEKPLSDQELEELDRFLLSDHTPDDAMTLDILHGYLTALVLCPDDIPASEWLPEIWGTLDQPETLFKSEKEAQRITSLIARFKNEIALTFEAAPREFEPLFCAHEVANRQLLDPAPWALGFMEGYHLREQAWQKLNRNELAGLFSLIDTLSQDEGEEDPHTLHSLALKLEADLPMIWYERQKFVRLS